ncbi:cell surface glycoprotein 1-like [Bacillus rossius redtenbacheri]|uniref:cell surface glycoprotein 1-like n=1 Tax=Bacillus rossius redtenbacheri TaxID=93214 RepID=UPI002FDDF994
MPQDITRTRGITTIVRADFRTVFRPAEHVNNTCIHGIPDHAIDEVHHRDAIRPDACATDADQETHATDLLGAVNTAPSDSSLVHDIPRWNYLAPARRHHSPPDPAPQRYVLTPPDSSQTLEPQLARPDSSPTPCDSSPTSCITTLQPPDIDIILPLNHPATPGIPTPTRRLIEAPPPGFDAIMSPDCPATSPRTAPVDAATPQQHTPQTTSETKTRAAQPSAHPTPAAKHQPVSEAKPGRAEHRPRLLSAHNEPPDRSHPTRRPAPWPPPIQSRYRRPLQGTADAIRPDACATDADQETHATDRLGAVSTAPSDSSLVHDIPRWHYLAPACRHHSPPDPAPQSDAPPPGFAPLCPPGCETQLVWPASFHPMPTAPISVHRAKTPNTPNETPSKTDQDTSGQSKHTPQTTSETKTRAAQPSAHPTPAAKHQPVSEAKPGRAEQRPRLLPAHNEPPDRSHPTRRPAPWPPPIQSRYRRPLQGTDGGSPPPG